MVGLNYEKIFYYFINYGFFSCSSLVVFAEESETIIEQENILEQPVPEEIVSNEIIVEFPESFGTYAINEDDYNSPEIMPYALNNNVYAGSYNSTILSIWNGLIQNNVGKDYLAYRSSQYQYYIFFGEDFSYSNGRFTGSGTYYSLNTQSNGYNYGVGKDSFSVNVSDAYVYTNVTSDFPALDNDRGLIYEQIQAVLLIALLSFNVLRWIFYQ